MTQVDQLLLKLGRMPLAVESRARARAKRASRHSFLTSFLIANVPPFLVDLFGPGAYDETLLAVIGILDQIRLESNIAGWIRAGGLWKGVGNVVGGTTGDRLRGLKRRRHSSGGTFSTENITTAEDDLISEPGPPWFSDPVNLAYWIARGRRAIEILGIKENAGL
jgi:hypothetical protein